MSGFMEDLKAFFNTNDLYEVLGVQKEASKDDIKKAYRKMALLVHPDRVPMEEKEKATAKFQLLGKLHSVLMDKNKRALYDEEGEIDEDDDILVQDRNWDDYWRLVFNVTVEDMKNFEEVYKGSEKEMKDLKEAYCESEGDMDHILESVLCCTFEDEPRFHDIIKQWIKDGSVPQFKFVATETKKKRQQRKKRYELEAKEAEELRKELGLDDSGEDSLKSLIQARQKALASEMDNLLDSLADKYGPKKKKGKSSKNKK